MSVFRIIAGGEIKDLSVIKINGGDRVICADRGFLYAQKLGIVPDLAVGDFDSCGGTVPTGCEVLRSVPEKDDTDTMLAVRAATERGADEIVIYGALGGRADHSLANIQTLYYALTHGCAASIDDGDNFITIRGRGVSRFGRVEGMYFSLFSYSEKAVVSLSGVKYPLDRGTLTNSFPLGVSNEITAAEAVLTVHDGVVLVVRSKM